MENELLKSYAEVDEILANMESIYVEKIPKMIRELFSNNRLEGYNPNINPKIHLDEQNLQKKTYSILAMLNLNYWCEDEKEKQKLISIYRENDRKREQELKEKYNIDNLFKNSTTIKPQQEIKQSTALIEYKENNFLKKILNQIINFFRKK